MASAFLAVIYSDYMLTSKTDTLYCTGKDYKPADLRKFAISQVYICSSLAMFACDLLNKIDFNFLYVMLND